jgi:hypothetical protein
MRNVPWPDGWWRAYFTPVTIVDDMVHVGTTVSATRTGRIEGAKIVERTFKQVLTFAWPPGAAAVLVHRGERGQSADAPQFGQPEEISANQYLRQGGMHFRNSLPSRGCSVHLVPTAYEAGRRVTGTPVTLDYPGLLRLGYSVVVKHGHGGRPVTAEIRIRSEFELGQPPPFVLVHNPERLPLEIEDGYRLPMKPAADPTASLTTIFRPTVLGTDFREVWHAMVTDLAGYVRLFVVIPPDRLVSVALFDPPVADLRLDAPTGRRGQSR